MRIGEMTMPADFRYREVYEHGQNLHTWTDEFRIRHPGMSLEKRAKIFVPFDALRGFSAVILAAEGQRALQEG